MMKDQMFQKDYCNLKKVKLKLKNIYNSGGFWVGKKIYINKLKTCTS